MSMISYTEAVKIVEQELLSIDLPLEILLNETIEEEFGWVFFYDSKEYLSTGNMSSKLAGNAPIIVDKNDGTVHETGTAEPIDVYIERYRKNRKV